MDASVAAGMTPVNHTCSILVKGLARESTPHSAKASLEIHHDGQKSRTSCLKVTLYNTMVPPVAANNCHAGRPGCGARQLEVSGFVLGVDADMHDGDEKE